LINLKAIHKRFGSGKLKNLPKLGLFERYFYQNICGIQTVNLLDLVSYNKQRAKSEVESILHWKDYGGKHYESIFTRFYQGYYLPTKFNVDKRKAHLSNLILSGQITRAEALIELENPPYSLKDQVDDKDYVLKKLGFSLSEWEEIMTSARIEHDAFDNEKNPIHQIKYFLFRLIMYLPVKMLRALSILHTPKQIGTKW
jgi:hypothetical protein